MGAGKSVRRSLAAWVWPLIPFVLLGCTPESDSVPGRYVARYQWGTDTLDIRNDLTFSQVVEGGGAPTERTAGTWRIERRGVDTRILLAGCLYGHDEASTVRPSSKKGVCDMVVANWWGTLGIGWEKASAWKKVDE